MQFTFKVLLDLWSENPLAATSVCIAILLGLFQITKHFYWDPRIRRHATARAEVYGPLLPEVQEVIRCLKGLEPGPNSTFQQLRNSGKLDLACSTARDTTAKAYAALDDYNQCLALCRQEYESCFKRILQPLRIPLPIGSLNPGGVIYDLRDFMIDRPVPRIPSESEALFLSHWYGAWDGWITPADLRRAGKTEEDIITLLGADIRIRPSYHNLRSKLDLASLKFAALNDHLRRETGQM